MIINIPYAIPRIPSMRFTVGGVEYVCAGSPLSESGIWTVEENGDHSYKVKFLTSGSLVFTAPVGYADIFLVGGGGGAGGIYDTWNTSWAGSGGGGGGYTLTQNRVLLSPGTTYSIVVGAGGTGSNTSNTAGTDGGATSAFGYSVAGGKGTIYTTGSSFGRGGAGGSGGGCGNGYYSISGGGDGGSDGGDGGTGGAAGAAGQGITTREFGESTGTLYAGGGGGGGSGAGGAGGGGAAGIASIDWNGVNGTANTGGGGGGACGIGVDGYGKGGDGGSGIIVIRRYYDS